MSSPLIIRLGETGEVFQKRISSGVRVNRQPAGINFYGLDWDKAPYAWVRFVQGDHSIDVHHVNGAQTSEDLEVFKEEGFTEWTVHALLDPKQEIQHDEAAARIHVARATVRRAERGAVALAATESVNPQALQYLNRLSDYLFVLARSTNAGADPLWTPGSSRAV